MNKEQIYNFLDEFNYEHFLTNGKSIQRVKEEIENLYDGFFYSTYGIYPFDILTDDEVMEYFINRYNVRFQPYTDWVVRINGTN